MVGGRPSPMVGQPTVYNRRCEIVCDIGFSADTLTPGGFPSTAAR